MTDKYIINGVDVAGCRYFISEWDFNNCGHICKGTECKYKRLWYKKQLQRKEQECEALQMSENEAGEIIAELKAECEELNREKRNFYNFLTNKYNYGSFRPMWGAYLLKRFFKEDLGDFFDEAAYEMADTIEEKEKQIDQLKAENDTYKKMFEDKDMRLALTEIRTGERHLWFNKAEKLKQTLTEIKEIAITGLEGFCPKCSRKECEDNNCIETAIRDILQKISECEAENEKV